MACYISRTYEEVSTYWEELKTVAAYYGYILKMIDRLRRHWFQPEEAGC